MTDRRSCQYGARSAQHHDCTSEVFTRRSLSALRCEMCRAYNAVSFFGFLLSVTTDMLHAILVRREPSF